MLMYASQVGHEESVRALIEKGASLDAVDKVRIPT
jgi:ankyrin repeat protein